MASPAPVPSVSEPSTFDPSKLGLAPAFAGALERFYPAGDKHAVRLSWKKPLGWPDSGMGTLCSVPTLSEEMLARVRVDFIDVGRKELMESTAEAHVDLLRITQTLPGGAQGAEKLCSTVWPDGGTSGSDRSGWDSVLYNSANVPSGDPSDPLIRSLVMDSVSGAFGGAPTSAISKRFLFKRSGNWDVTLRIAVLGTTVDVADCVEAPGFTFSGAPCSIR